MSEKHYQKPVWLYHAMTAVGLATIGHKSLGSLFLSLSEFQILETEKHVNVVICRLGKFVSHVGMENGFSSVCKLL